MELRTEYRLEPILRSTGIRVHFLVSSSGDEDGEGTVRNLSFRGCRVASEVPVEPGTHLALQLQIPGTDSSIAIDLATVRWAREGEFGLEFLSAWPEEWTRLREVLRELEPAVAA